MAQEEAAARSRLVEAQRNVEGIFAKGEEEKAELLGKEDSDSYWNEDPFEDTRHIGPAVASRSTTSIVADADVESRSPSVACYLAPELHPASNLKSPIITASWTADFASSRKASPKGARSTSASGRGSPPPRPVTRSQAKGAAEQAVVFTSATPSVEGYELGDKVMPMVIPSKSPSQSVTIVSPSTNFSESGGRPPASPLMTSQLWGFRLEQ